jgi:predicted MFS family arabinose efflux permease
MTKLPRGLETAHKCRAALPRPVHCPPLVPAANTWPRLAAGDRSRPLTRRSWVVRLPASALVSSLPSLSSEAAKLCALDEAGSGQNPVVPLSLSMFLIGTGEVIASPMMLEMAQTFGVSSARVAWLPGIYALTYAALGPLLGPFSDRFGRKALLVPGLVGLGLSVTATALAPSFAAACCTSALGGACAGAIQPNALAIINDSVHEARQPDVTGKVFLGLTSSFVIVPALGGLLASRVDWRVPYFLMAGACLVAAVLVARLRVRSSLTPASAALFSTFRLAFDLPFMRLRFAVSFLWLGICIGLGALFAEALRRRFGLPTQTVGIWTGCFGLAVLLGNLLMDRARRVFGSHFRVLLYGSLATIVGAAVVDVLPPLPLYVLIPAGLAWGLGYGMAGPAHHFMVASSAGDVRGTVVAINASILNSGLMAVTLIAGRLLDQTGVELLVAGLLVLQLVGVGLMLRLPRTRGLAPLPASR